MFNPQKFKSLVHYICWKCSDDPSKLGSVKLNKAVWLSDLRAYYGLGHPITGARYVKRQFGPVPSAILPVLRELEDDGSLTIRESSYYGNTKREYIATTAPPAGFMEADEQAIVDRVIEFVSEKHTAMSISEASHDHIWKAAKDGEEIPHFTVFARPGKLTEDELEWARMKLGHDF